MSGDRHPEPGPALPQPPGTGISPETFVSVPLSCLSPLTPEQWLWQQALYEQALAQARAVVRPSLPERDLLGVWN
jgi:hypothetical protein